MKRHLHSESPDPGNAHPPQHAAAVRKRVTPCGSKRYGPDTYSPQFRIYQRHSPYSKKKRTWNRYGSQAIFPDRPSLYPGTHPTCRHRGIFRNDQRPVRTYRKEKTCDCRSPHNRRTTRRNPPPSRHQTKPFRMLRYPTGPFHAKRRRRFYRQKRRLGNHRSQDSLRPHANQGIHPVPAPCESLSFRFNETTVSLVEEKRSVKIKDVVQPLHFPGGNLIDNCIRSLPTAGTTSNQQREKYR